MPNIHPTALVDSGAVLADDVEIGPYSIIENEVTLGPACRIGPHCVIGKGTVLGADNRTFSGAQLGVAPQDLKHIADATGHTIIGDHNIFREFVTVSSGTVYGPEDTGKATRIGSHCLFMACSHVAHDCSIGDRVIMANSSALAGHVEVQDAATIGGLAGVHQFCRIGTMAFIGGMARVNMDVLPYMIIEGHPAHCYGPNVVGLTRGGFSKESIARIRRVYRILYRSGLNTSQALVEIEKSVEESEDRNVLLNFIRGSQRGILR
ncbi:MAG: Acyl-(acyl-carrier-protein)--UDP-N-acetylglucosamine O-acyltransferase [Candidatus Hydrogenedentes bacterium ADurb.Bin101]|jgi:UDP-N-acetylglucosamine acyltransferase|nr:acyl-ACP--UDP-N-acetylglucosamine O-acyltransferase [Candidatus Hydrogenedentota bacterium]OQC05112.1 MAG: Acyl-(acyl-carrier-protein)--UDP-N-acetylglucosamine O-acyltransferase [Candidatus Hydrogenedentes bacterium ADurb.Bin101]HOC70331.1 acyl-ACP--UDP-N-acetylglucosamine O-acyltransferase [Candidatus Hydrogenedentota bacterium]